MKVKKLIEELRQYDPEATVMMHHREGEPVLFALRISEDSKRVWLESESDGDMEDELHERFIHAAEDWDDEVDFYSELLDTGIDVDMVRRYLGNEVADHMKRFCEDHGLI